MAASSLRPLQLVDGPSSPGPSSAPYANMVSPTSTKPNVNRRLSLQLQPSSSTRLSGTLTTPSSPAPTTPAHLKRHSTQGHSMPSNATPRTLTLVERHADLLSFIAQKEMKCLELRQQLAQHEAELVALKRKWERIVARGSVPPGSATVVGGGHQRASTDSSMSMDSFTTGFKDGVGRMLQFSGLGDVFPAIPAGAADDMSSPASAAQRADRAAEPSGPRAALSKRDSLRLSMSGSSTSTTSLSEVDGEFDERDEPDDSHPPTPSEELLLDPVSLMPIKTPTPESQLAISSSSSSESLNRPPPASRAATMPSPLSPLPLHSTALAGLVPAVNRKWEELRGTETLQKSQRRASALLTDVFNALVPPVPEGIPPKTPTAASPTPPTSSALKPARRSTSTLNPNGLSLTHAPGKPKAKTSGTASTSASASRSSSTTPKADTDDEWNW